MNWQFINDLQDIYSLLDEIGAQTAERDYPILWEKIHATSCAQIGRMLAEKRGVDVEWAALACALHDIGRWFSGRQNEHAPKGEEPVRAFLTQRGETKETKELIIKAVINHSKKEEIGSPLEEIVKDADILDCHWHGEDMTKPFHIARLRKALEDLNIQT
ncbi:metal-dependent phosphohydrolase [Desulfosporosinus sp. HMP52]|uniref:HD domain-containing protein n=1 Tax=Desulfosporosinus sp. HMP52 TaxID=1487923 RepID=UPI00051F87C4|nr:HD domain-containing protein [Desulfosporosinus sp. HMP52]KGK89684.1 metal-dependent phosphohydrolase [Desulfosporosinus sp. HMP52]